MARIVTRKLGLAAYLKMRGGKLIEHSPDKGGFVFETDDEHPLDFWEFEYLNSCCHRHDTELVHLRKLLR